MPMADELPATLRQLVDCNAAEVRPDPDFANDMNRLADAISGNPYGHGEIREPGRPNFVPTFRVEMQQQTKRRSCALTMMSLMLLMAFVWFLQPPSINSLVRGELRLVAWNVESGGNDPAVIAKQLVDNLGRYDIYGLSEVDPGNTRLYLKSIQAQHGDGYQSVVTLTGNKDRMMLVYDAWRLEKLEHAELEAHDGVRMNDVNFRHRSPLMARFKDKATDVEFIGPFCDFASPTGTTPAR